MKYIISTLGCKVNQYETQAMEALLLAHGHKAAAEDERADAVIVNSCAVTAESGRKTRQLIRRLHEENPEAVIAVCGCYSQLEPESVKALGARVVFGAAERTKFVTAVERAVAEGEETALIDKPFERRVFEEMPAGALGGRTRAMLKIQDGCVNFCTYCIIPYTRGRLRSLPLADAAAETARLAAEGYRELVLTGIEIASYGVDLPGKPGLIELIETLAATSGEMRLRLGSLEPTVITEDFCRRAAATGKLCRHFHLSLQSGCDRTLKAMNRKYDTAGFYHAVELLRHLRDRGVPCALVTSSPRYQAEKYLGGPGLLPLFEAIVTGDLHLPSKPAPDVYLRGAELLNVDIRRCAVLEDSWNGLRAGRQAGATTIMVPDLAPYGPEIAPCVDHVAANLREAEAILCR